MTTENLFEPNCIRTHSGNYIDVLNPNPDLIDINDIAHSLSMQCRFGGHTKVFYSVAQHSFECAKRVSKEFQLAALLHDASEAFLLDIPSPIKHRLTNYKEIENNLMQVIADKFGFQWPLQDEIKHIDGLMLQLEWYSLVVDYNPEELEAWSPQKAKLDFLMMLNNIIKNG